MASLLLTLLGALAGAALTWLLGRNDRILAKEAAGFQRRIAGLEAERSRAENLLRFRPSGKILGNEKSQILRLEADEPFEVESVDYLNANEARLASESVGKSGVLVEIPIREDHLVQIMNFGPYVHEYDHSAAMVFRVNIRKNGRALECKYPAHLNGSLRKVIG
jgi:hypothetical protein